MKVLPVSRFGAVMWAAILGFLCLTLPAASNAQPAEAQLNSHFAAPTQSLSFFHSNPPHSDIAGKAEPGEYSDFERALSLSKVELEAERPAALHLSKTASPAENSVQALSAQDIAAQGTGTQESVAQDIVEHEAAAPEQREREAAARDLDHREGAELDVENGDGPETAPLFDEDDFDIELPGLQSRVRARRPIRAASEHVVKSEVIKGTPKTGATDVLRMVPGLVASKHGGEGKSHQLFLRGFDAVHGQDIEINIGGIPVNEVSHVHALGHADTNFLIPEAVREVTVYESSHRAFQGDFAIAGTVDMKLGLSQPGFFFAPSLGSFGLQRMVAGWAQEGNEETFIALEGARAEGFGPERAHGRLAGLAQFKRDISSGTLRLLAGSYGTRFDSPGALREDAVDSIPHGFYGIHTSGQGGSASRHQALAEYSHNWLNGSQSTASVWGLNSAQDLRYNFTGFRSDPLGDGLEQLTDTWSFGTQLRHRHPFSLLSRRLVLELGLGMRHDIIDQAQNGYSEADGSVHRKDLLADINQTHLFGFAEGVWLLGDWNLRLGTRIDGLVLQVVDHLTVARRTGISNPVHDRDTSGFRMGLKAGVSRALGERWRIFADYGDGFRTPQARSLSQGEKTPFIAAHGGEIGARYESRRLAASLSGFGTYVANDFFFDHALGTTWHTGPTARGGVQGALSANPVEGLHLAGHLTWAHAVVLETGSQLAYFAPLVGRLDSTWEKPFELFGQTFTGQIGLAFTGIGPRPLLHGDTSRTVFLADSRLSLGWRFVSLRLDLTNLFNSQWRDGEYTYASKFGESSSLLPSRHFTAGPPRTLWATLEFRL